MKNILNASLIFISILFMFFLQSCYTTYRVDRGNVHQQAIGKTKNEILRTYGVPNRTTSDAIGGEVLIYESRTAITNSYGNSAAQTYGGAVYGNGAAYGAATGYGATSSTTETSVEIRFVNLFIDRYGIVYDYKSNYGTQFSFEKCFNKTKTWVSVSFGALFFPPSLIITLPIGLGKQAKAKKEGKICNKKELKKYVIIR